MINAAVGEYRSLENLDARLTDQISRATEEGSVVGAVVVVARRGKIVYSRAAGFADREAKRLMAVDAIFRLSSVTKPFVSVAALALKERGTLNLYDAVTDFIPEFRPKLPNDEAPLITIQHLLTHTAGLNYGFAQTVGNAYEAAGVSDGLDQPGLTMGENLRRIASVPLSFRPGEGWAYSVATDVLGEVLARVTGTSLPEVVDRFVLRPLGLNDTGFEVRDRLRLAVPYTDDFPQPCRMGTAHKLSFQGGTLSYSPDRIFNSTSFSSGGTGLAGTADDIVTFLETLRKGGAPLISPSSVAALTTPAVADRHTGIPGWGWSQGFSILTDPASADTPQSMGTWQWGGVYGHSWFVDPARELTAVSLTNTAVAGMAGNFPNAIRNILCSVFSQSA